jgi:hypothetical protein
VGAFCATLSPMATLTIREYEHLAALSGGTLQCGQELAVASQSISISGGSLQGAALNIRTRHVRVRPNISECAPVTKSLL